MLSSGKGPCDLNLSRGERACRTSSQESPALAAGLAGVVCLPPPWPRSLVHYPEAGVGLGGRKALCCPPASPLRPVALPRSEGLGPTPAPSSCPLTVLSLFLGLYPTPCTTCLSRTPCCLFLCEDYRTLAADPEEGRSARTVQSRESPRGVAVRGPVPRSALGADRWGGLCPARLPQAQDSALSPVVLRSGRMGCRCGQCDGAGGGCYPSACAACVSSCRRLNPAFPLTSR